MSQSNGHDGQQPMQMNATLSVQQLAVATDMLMAGQVNALLSAKVPPQLVVDVLYSVMVKAIASMEHPMERSTVVSNIVSGLGAAVTMMEVQVRKSSKGVIVDAKGLGKA